MYERYKDIGLVGGGRDWLQNATLRVLLTSDQGTGHVVGVDNLVADLMELFEGDGLDVQVGITRVNDGVVAEG